MDFLRCELNHKLMQRACQAGNHNYLVPVSRDFIFSPEREASYCFVKI